MQKIIIIWFVLFPVSFLYPQVSLYDGRNPYTGNYNDGDIVRVYVNNVFNVTINGEWNRNLEVNLKMEPDKDNLAFLKKSQQSRNNQRQSKERQNVQEKFKFNVSAIINKQVAGFYKITANKTVSIDGKITRVLCTGLISEKSIVNGSVNSDEIADLNLVIVSQPQPVKDDSYNGALPEKENNEKNTEKEQNSGNFNKEQVKAYVIEQLREILGALK